MPVRGISRVTPADDDEGLDSEDQRQPGGQQLLERTVAADRDPQPAAHHEQVADQQGGRAEQAQLVGDHREDQVGRRFGDGARVALAWAFSEQTARARWQTSPG